MRTARAVVAATVVAVIGTGLAACGRSQADELAKQLRDAGYTHVVAKADYDTKYNRKKRRNERKLDDYEATARAGSCTVKIEQDVDSDDYVIEAANGNAVDFSNLTARQLVTELNKRGVKC